MEKAKAYVDSRVVKANSRQKTRSTVLKPSKENYATAERTETAETSSTTKKSSKNVTAGFSKTRKTKTLSETKQTMAEGVTLALLKEKALSIMKQSTKIITLLSEHSIVPETMNEELGNDKVYQSCILYKRKSKQLLGNSKKLEAFLLERIERKLMEINIAQEVDIDQMQEIQSKLDSRLERLKKLKEQPYMLL